MPTPEILDVDPLTLHLPPSRIQGADPAKLQRQIAKYGRRTDGMPLIEVHRGTDGPLMIYDGVTRATRVAKLLPGTLVKVQVIGTINVKVSRFPKVGDRLP